MARRLPETPKGRPKRIENGRKTSTNRRENIDIRKFVSDIVPLIILLHFLLGSPLTKASEQKVCLKVHIQ